MGASDRTQTVVAIGLIAAAAAVSAWFVFGPPADRDGPTCTSVGPSLLRQIQAMTQSEVVQARAVPSTLVPDVWLVASHLGQGVGVWSTNVPPTADQSGLIVAANEVARADQVVEIQTPSESVVGAAQAQRDAEGIAAAEDCLSAG